MSYQHITYELQGQVALIRFNDPQTLNAVSMDMGHEFANALHRAEREARAIVLGSHGRAFCSGANLSDRGMTITDPHRDTGYSLETLFNPLIQHVRGLSIPFITAVRGAAAGVGCAFALSGDLVVAGESAYFFQAFCKIGLVPDGGSSYFLTRTIGRVRAMEMMMLGDRLPAAKALDWGLINRVVADEEVEKVALELAAQLANGPRSLGLIRRMAWAAVDNSLTEQLDMERWYQQMAGRSDDFAEGVTAFLEKRPAKFQGK